MFQQITLVGNLGRDPEMRYTASGIPVTSFSVACSRKMKDGDKTVWFRISAWRESAEACNKYLTKGSRVLVVGELEEPKVFTGGDGTARSSLEVTAHQVKFLTPKGEPTPAKQESYKQEDVEEIPF